MLYGEMLILNREKRVFKDKVIAINLFQSLSRFEIGISFQVRRKGQVDHHGFVFSVAIILWSFEFEFYDTRHAEDFK